MAHLIEGLAPLGVIGLGLAGHALMRARFANLTTPGTLRSDRVVRHGPRRYYDPLGLPLHSTGFRLRLIPVALP